MAYDKILVIKVGTSTLARKTLDGATELDRASFQRIAQQAKELQKNGYGILIVSSAAITAGMAHLNVSQRPSRLTEIPELQRLASIGWRLVLNAWDDAFDGQTVGELLVTKQELDNTLDRTELVQVIHQLLTHNNIAIVNENDAIAHEEIAFGDNDTLAAHIAARLQQSPHIEVSVSFVILSDIEGVYGDKNDASTLISTINDIDTFQHIAQETKSDYGTGGMTTKFLAAKIAKAARVETRIGKGRQEDILQLLLANETGTHFPT